MKQLYVATISFICLVFSLADSTQAQGTSSKVVVIDAGHGGHDPGAIGITGVKEKDIVLKLALQLGTLIQKNHPNIKVVYTRKSDVFVELRDRTLIANNNKADVFISIHCNAVDKNNTAHGTESFVMGLDKSEANLAVAQKENAAILSEQNYEENYNGFDPSSPEAYIMFSMFQNKFLDESIKLAAAIQSEFKNKLKRHDRGVKQAPFLVLYRSTMPSVLVEAGFLSNKEEEAYLASAKGQTELVTAMYNGLSKMLQTKTIEVDFTGIDTSTVRSAGTKPNSTTETPASTSQNSVVYKVQFMFIPQKLEKNDPQLKNLPDIEIEKYGNGYKYTTGSFDTHAKAKELLVKVKEAGFKDAFIVALDKPTSITNPSKPTNDKTSSESTSSDNQVTYKVQFMSMPQKLAKNDPKLKGLPDIEIEQVGNTYRYTTGKCSTQTQADQLLEKTKNAGFKDAFIVCFNAKGERITLQQARDLENR